MTIDEAIAKYKDITNTDASCPRHCMLPCDECVQECKQILERLEEWKEQSNYDEDDYYLGKYTAFNQAIDIVQEVAEEYNGGWIPVKTRPMTEEEKEHYSEYLVDGNGMIYECTLPNDGQEVLITSKFGHVDKTIFCTDCGNYFENYEDYDEVVAWQPLPEPYKESEHND